MSHATSHISCGQYCFLVPVLSTCVFAVFTAFGHVISGPGSLSLGSRRTCWRIWLFTSVPSRKSVLLTEEELHYFK